jgi:hypothetical protein
MGYVSRGEMIPPGVYRLSAPVAESGSHRVSEVLSWSFRPH